MTGDYNSYQTYFSNCFSSNLLEMNNGSLAGSVYFNNYNSNNDNFDEIMDEKGKTVVYSADSKFWEIRNCKLL